MSMIDITNLTFQYEGSYDPVFEDISFRIDTDWKLGFTGRNGRGKTTFCNLLLGKYDYKGSIKASVDFQYFPLDIRDKSMDTIDILFSDDQYTEIWAVEKELSLLNVESDVLYRPFSTLSNGEQTKVMLAAMFAKENNFLLIDEPTNHLDAEGRELLTDYLNSKKGFILISHDRNFLDACIDHILVINKTNIEVQQGNFSSWWYNKQAQDSNEMTENEKLKKDIKRLNKAARETARWSDKVEKGKRLDSKRDMGVKPDKGHIGRMAAKMMKRSKSAEQRINKAAEQKEKLLKNIERLDELSIDPEPYFKKRLISAVDLSICYGETAVFSDLTFNLDEGDRIALIGKNGSGKSSLLKKIMGEDIESCGNLSVGSNLKISYVPQDSSFLKGSLKKYAAECNIDESIFKSILRKMDFPRVQLTKDMEDFSLGQKKKVLIARSLCEKANLYIWDEPLNYVDVFSRMQIEMLLDKYDPTMIFVEHDKEFVSNVATKLLYLC